MSTNKLLQSLSEDPQLEKQIGCMAGILQLFDRHQVLTGRRLYGHKRIAATASKMQTPSASNCGSPGSDSSGILNENALKYPTEQQRQKHVPATGVVASLEQQRSQPPHTPTTPTEAKNTLAFSKTTLLTANEATTAEVNGRDQLPKISFEMARSSLLTPRRLDSSRSLHEARVNVAHESTKVFARKSVDTAERAAAAARGALKELSRISTDFTGPSPPEDQVSIRDIVRSSLAQDYQAPRSSTNVHSSFPPRMASEANTCAPRATIPRDMSRVHNAESKSSSECHSVHASHTSTPQAGGRVEASRPPRHSKPKVETPQKSCADISESLRLLAKLREASPTSYNSLPGNEGAEGANGGRYSLAAHHVPQQARSSQVDLAREGPAFSSRASLPRVASDRLPGRMSSCEPSRASSVVDSLLHPKAREGPRLSLDGRVAGGGIKADCEAGSQSKLHPRTLLTSRSVSCSNSDCDTESLHEKRTSFNSNVVAKLMGLDEMPNGEAHPKLGLTASSDQKSMRASSTVMQDVNPTFTQCGKYVSASFFPSRRRDDIKIVIDSEEEEEESDLHLESLSHQDARTLNVRVGSLKSQEGDRLVTSESGNHLGGHTCYQPKNHHLIEDRPPHVLSPAARLCAQIEEMQRADSVYKGFDKDTRTLGLPQSSKPELEALKQLLGAIQLKKEHAKSCVEKFPMRGSPRKLQPESGWMPFPYELHPQAEQPSAVTWNTKRMLNDEFDSHMHEHNVNTRRNPSEIQNRKVKNGIHERALHLPSRQHMPAENYNHGPRIRADAYISPSSSMCNTPRKSPMGSDYVSPGGTHNVQATPPMKGARRIAHPHTSPNGQPSKFSASPRTPMNQQLRSSNNGGSSWEVSSVSSTSSSNAREHYVSSYCAANKQKKQSERGLEKKKVGILKDKEESKANLVSLKPSPVRPTEKKAKSGGVAPSANSRTLRKPILAQNDNLRLSMRTPTRSVARKEVDVKRKLNLSNHSASGLPPPLEQSIEDEEVDFVDKTVVSSIENMQLSKSSVELNEAGHHMRDPNKCMSVGSRENDLGFLVNTPSINRVRTEAGGAKGPLLPLADPNAVASTFDGEVISTIFNGDVAGTINPICTPSGALRLPQVLQRENEDTESQGDKSTGSCEQPSPISVLEGPFYEDDVASPPTTTKFVLKLEELEEEARAKASAGSSSQRPSPFLNRDGELQSLLLTDAEYMKHLIQISCVAPQDDAEDTCNVWKLRPLDSHYFLQLEEQVASNHDIDAALKSELGSTMWRRKMLFDSVNASLETRLHAWRLCQHQPWLLACERGLHGTIASGCSSALRQGIVGVDEENNVCLSNEGGKVLVEEVREEIEANTTKQRGIVGGVGTSVCEGEEVNGDEVGHMLEEDIMGRSQRSGRPDAWVTLLAEKGELGLDLERLIFKDLIDHTIRDLGLLHHLPLALNTKRQLFKHHN